MIRWLIYGLICVVALATVTLAWEHYVIAPAEARGAAKQEAKDAPVIAKLQAQLDQAQIALKDAQAAADNAARAYQVAQANAQADALQAKEANDAKLATLNAEVAKLSNDKRIVLSAYARLVFNDVSRTANRGGQAAAAAPGNHAAANPVPSAPVAISERQLGQYDTDAGKAFVDSWGGWNACISFYNSLRSKQ